MTRRKALEPYVVEQGTGRHYVTPDYYEMTYGRSQRTVRDWIRTNQVRSMWSGDVLYVHLQDCRKLDERAAKQDRRTKEEAS